MGFFISSAMAAAPTTAAAPQAGGAFSMIMMVALFVVFYLLFIRPQNKRAKEHRDMLAKVKKGDEVVISGSILGKVVSFDEQYTKVTLAEGVDVIVQRHAISAMLPKGTLKSL